MSETRLSEPQPGPITLEDAQNVTDLLHEAVRLRHTELSPSQVDDHIQGTITHTVYQTEIHGTYQGTRDMFLAFRAGTFDPTIGDPSQVLNPLKIDGRISQDTINALQASVDARAQMRNGSPSQQEIANQETAEADRMFGTLRTATTGEPREMAVAYAYVGGLYAAHAEDAYNANRALDISRLIAEQAELSVQ